MKLITNSRAISLLEVLIAVVIIAVALFGILISLSAQQVAEGQMRDSKVLRQLHYQLVREYLKNQRDQDNNNLLTTVTSSPIILTNKAINDTIYLTVTNPSANTYNSLLYTLKNGNKFASSSLTFYWPYTNWQGVQP